MDSANFNLLSGAVLAAVAAILVGPSVGKLGEKNVSNFALAAFALGCALGLIALFGLHRAYMLRLAHRHAEQHMCPDPSAHDAPSGSSPSHIDIKHVEHLTVINPGPGQLPSSVQMALEPPASEDGGNEGS
jgi:hypothetical protein